jgi:hypothetical protein
MAKLTLSRIELTIFDKVLRKSFPARFYVRPENDVNMSIFNALKKALFGSKYGSTTVNEISTTPVLQAGSMPSMVKFYNKETNSEEDFPLVRIDKFTTGYNPVGEDKPQNFVIQLNSMSFKTTSKENKDYFIDKFFKRNFHGNNPGIVENFEALQHLNLSLKDDATCEAIIDKSDNGSFYIVKFLD